MEENELNAPVERFIVAKIESVPHLEALLLLWNTRPKDWTAQELAQRLYVSTEAAGRILLDLLAEELITDTSCLPKQYRCTSSSEESTRLLNTLDKAYRTDLIRISNLIHSKPASAVREFARAFRFTKERE